MLSPLGSPDLQKGRSLPVVGGGWGEADPQVRGAVDSAQGLRLLPAPFWGVTLQPWAVQGGPGGRALCTVTAGSAHQPSPHLKGVPCSLRRVHCPQGLIRRSERIAALRPLLF